MVTDSRTLHHYWSHTDVSPWSADGSLMLSQRADVGGVQDVLEGSRTSLHQDIGFTNFTTGSRPPLIAVQSATHSVQACQAVLVGLQSKMCLLCLLLGYMGHMMCSYKSVCTAKAYRLSKPNCCVSEILCCTTIETSPLWLEVLSGCRL